MTMHFHSVHRSQTLAFRVWHAGAELLLAPPSRMMLTHSDSDVDTRLSKSPGDIQYVPVRIEYFKRMIQFS
jgi:hypothetical protein